MDYNIADKIYYNKDLMDIIYQYDPTYLDKHKLLLKNNLNIIGDKAHDFWYYKYEKALYESDNIKYILELQSAFFDTLEIIGFIF